MADKKPKMVSLKRTPEDRRKDMGEAVPIEAMAPDYPWGFCIRADGDELDKMGMKELPQVGTVIPMTILVKVTSVSQSAAEGRGEEYDESRQVSFQITDIAVG